MKMKRSGLDLKKEGKTGGKTKSSKMEILISSRLIARDQKMCATKIQRPNRV